jgi:hypothetical protein
MSKYGERTLKYLFGGASACAHPECSVPLIERQRGQLTVVVEIAHIRSEKADGPRHDPAYPISEINSFDNLLLLCPRHHKPVDDNESDYTVEELERWKQDQVTQAGQQLSPQDLSIIRERFTGAAADWQSAEAVSRAAASIRMVLEVGARGRRVSQDAADGQRLEVQPSEVETAPYREALRKACVSVQSELQTHVDGVLAAVHTAAEMRPDLAPWCSWVDREVRAVSDAAGRWPAQASLNDDEVWPRALDALQRSGRALAGAWRGDPAEEPPPPPVLSAPEPDPFQVAVQHHADLVEASRPWARVDHLKYDPDRYADLVRSFGFAVTLPPTMSWAPLALSTTARLAARLAKNADDDTFQRLIDEAPSITPAAAACVLLRELAVVAREGDRSALAERAAAAFITTLWAQDWSDPVTWTANANGVHVILDVAASLIGPDEVNRRLTALLQADSTLVPAMLLGCAAWLEVIPFFDSTASGRAIRFFEQVPVWFPRQAAVDAVHAELPDVVPLDKWASDDIDDDVVRLAAQLLYVDQRDAEHRHTESVQD